jgi:hypothetical protein
MGAIAELIRTSIEGLVTPFDWLGSFWGLTLLSLLSGVGMLWVVGKTTPQKLVERSRNRMDSAIYEIRLFIDSPKWVLRSLGRLMSHSLLYIAFMLPAFVILAVPLGTMYLSLEARHGLDAVELEKPFVVTVELAHGVDGRTLEAQVPAGLELTAPPMYVASKPALYLRMVAHEARTHTLKLAIDGATIRKEIVSDPGATQVSPERASGLDLLLSYGAEAGLSGPVTSISVPHPTKTTSYLGIDMPWWLWWLLLMMVSAFGLRKQLGVAL